MVFLLYRLDIEGLEFVLELDIVDSSGLVVVSLEKGCSGRLRVLGGHPESLVVLHEGQVVLGVLLQNVLQ